MQLKLSTGLKCTSKIWKNTIFTWEALVARLETPVRTSETTTEYVNMTKVERDAAKDVGGYVGGTLKHGARKAENIKSRSILTLDVDYAEQDFIEKVNGMGIEAVIYSTHSHTPEKPRYRLVIPLENEIPAEKYQPLGRAIAYALGIEQFDDTTYQPHRLMYWPSCSHDAEYIFEYFQGIFVDADMVLERKYGHDWQDASQWPRSKRVDKVHKNEAKKQGDPLQKEGLIGAFCRSYTIHEAIATFLSEVYAPCQDPNRYTFIAGSTSGGAVVYDDVFLYSNHGTDPASGRLCNAWDLVRIHKFGEQEDEGKKEMQRLAAGDKLTKKTLIGEKLDQARTEFEDAEVGEAGEPEAEIEALEFTKNGLLKPTLSNMVIILKTDPRLKGIAFNKMSEAIESKSVLPWGYDGLYWRDADDCQLQHYVDNKYGVFPKNTVLTALAKVADDRAFHPVREYIDGLPKWDKIPRVDTLLIEYLGAEETDLNKAMTRKTLIALIARIYQPGIKFDTMLVLHGKPGIGKSTFLNTLAGDNWFSDSLKLTDIKDKTAAEKLQGVWLNEIGELSGLKKTDENTLKNFLSSRNDIYRVAYGRRATPHLRQSIFIGTTNDDEFLTDPTGNRRFWPVAVGMCDIQKSIWNDLQKDRDQILAEAYQYYKAGESLALSKDQDTDLEINQENLFMVDPWAGEIEVYLNKPIPLEWASMELSQRKAFLNGDFTADQTENLYPRDKVCIREVWAECLDGQLQKLGRVESARIGAILNRKWRKNKTVMRFGFYGSQKGWIPKA